MEATALNQAILSEHLRTPYQCVRKKGCKSEAILED